DIETLHGLSHEKTWEGNRQKALSTLIPLADKETMARCVTAFIIKGTVETRIMANFLLASGVQNIPWLFDIYLDAATPPSAALIEIMKGFGRNATEEAMKRFSSKGSQTLIRLLMFIRETDDRSVAPYLKNLYRHEDWTVKKEVLATLIQFDDPSIIELLRSSLSSPHREDVFQAVNLSCRYRVRDLLPDLTSMIKTFMIRDESAILNEWIVSELGKTGHPSVIPHFEKIAAIRFTLSPKHLTRMKVIVYEHLERFPRDQVMDLLKRGKRSFNRDIKKISSKILGDEAS
ncbi:MAG: HEAT repeat domain-containing protein, partial [Syntrophales bacterium LBB04]|nr:HEAT repeat domain-containing protein [Syntrophales bacterium LBB04]